MCFFIARWQLQTGHHRFPYITSAADTASLTLILLTWTKWRAPTNAGKWRMGFNSAFKGLNTARIS